MLISFETYALVKDKVRCEERGEVRVKGIADPVATYVVTGAQEEWERADSAHLRLEFHVAPHDIGGTGCGGRTAPTGAETAPDRQVSQSFAQGLSSSLLAIRDHAF